MTQIQPFRSIHRSLLTGLLTSFFSFAAAPPTTVTYNPNTVSGGPFPSNVLTAPDSTTATGLRVNLALQDEGFCDPGSHSAVCSNTQLLNRLDGFSVNPRVMVCFSAPVNLATLSAGLKIVPVSTPGAAVPLNQITYDASSKCAYGKPDTVLQQRSQYFLAVTDGLKDTNGSSVNDDGGFGKCLASADAYCLAVKAAKPAVMAQLNGAALVSGSLFTTLNATGWLEKVRAAVDTFHRVTLPAGFPYLFKLSDLQSVTWKPDNAGFASQDLPLSVLSGVDKVAFGLFLSPNYLNTSGPAAGTITTSGTQPVPIPGLLKGLTLGFLPVSYHVFLPAGTPPAGGWPMAIYGHGLSDNQFGAPTYIAGTLASQGIATIAMEITGHGFGPNGTVQVKSKSGSIFTEATPGRGIQLAAGQPIGPEDGCIVPGAIAIRDCARQTAIDLFALVNTIRQTAGLGLGLNGQRISYVGQSFGSIYGSLFQAVEPAVKVAVLNAGGGTSVDIARLALTGRPLSTEYLASISPALLNVASGQAPPEAYFRDAFNDAYPFRDQAPADITVAGALQLQAAFEAADWLGMIGDPLAFAPHFQTQPLPGVPAKATLFQYGYGDLEVPNPTEAALVRAAGEKKNAWFFRTDAAVAYGHPELLGITTGTVPEFPILPHRILSNPTIFSYPAETSIAIAEQKQVADFLLSSGTADTNPNSFLTGAFSPATPVFERLASTPKDTSERLNFLQIQP